MNCPQTQELLSAYYDGELPAGDHNSVADHLAQCEVCAEMVAGYGRLSQLSARSCASEPTGDWNELERRLAAAPSRSVGVARGRTLGLLATAAVILIAVVVRLVDQREAVDRPPVDAFALNFDRYLESFAQSPLAAQDALLANYRGEEADVASAAQLVGFIPAAHDPPEGFAVARVYVLHMPCCRCPEIVLQRPDGTCLTVFEHRTHQPWHASGHPAIHATCWGREAWIVEGANHLLAASWESNPRNLTIVGARDLQEIAHVVGHFERSPPRDPLWP
jgi:hypothetical protein